MVAYIMSISFILLIMWVVLANVRKFTVRGKYHPLVNLIAWLYIGAFVAVDVAFNTTVGNIVFLFKGAKTLTLTARLKYILSTERSGEWRYKLALFICSRLVEPWDFNHCGLSDD